MDDGRVGVEGLKAGEELLNGVLCKYRAPRFALRGAACFKAIATANGRLSINAMASGSQWDVN